MCFTGHNKSQFNVLWTSCIIHPDLLPTLTLCSTGSFPKKQDVKPSAAIFLTQFQHLCEEDGDNAISSASLILAISTQTWILSSAAGYCGVNHTSVTNHFSCSQSGLPIPPNFPLFFITHFLLPVSCWAPLPVLRAVLSEDISFSSSWRIKVRRGFRLLVVLWLSNTCCFLRVCFPLLGWNISRMGSDVVLWFYKIFCSIESLLGGKRTGDDQIWTDLKLEKLPFALVLIALL